MKTTADLIIAAMAALLAEAPNQDDVAAAIREFQAAEQKEAQQ